MTPRPPAHVCTGNAKHPRRKSPAVGGAGQCRLLTSCAAGGDSAALTGTTSPPSGSSSSSSGRSAEAPGGLCSSRTTSRSRPVRGSRAAQPPAGPVIAATGAAPRPFINQPGEHGRSPWARPAQAGPIRPRGCHREKVLAASLPADRDREPRSEAGRASTSRWSQPWLGSSGPSGRPLKETARRRSARKHGQRRGETVHVVAAANRTDLAGAEEAGGWRSHEGVRDRLGVVARRPNM
jgi:hypothetical protein